MSFTVAAYPRKRVSIDCSKDGLTEQSHAKACDVNRIVKRYERDGILMEKLPGYVDLAGAKFGNFADGLDYQEACNAVIMADRSFMEMPAEIRAKFYNDPAVFLDFASNPSNKDEMVELGLIKRDSIVEVEPPVASDGDGRTSST